MSLQIFESYFLIEMKKYHLMYKKFVKSAFKTDVHLLPTMCFVVKKISLAFRNKCKL